MFKTDSVIVQIPYSSNGEISPNKSFQKKVTN